MSLPTSHLIESPILQELAATGGSDEVRFLYERLIGYFPQINEKEIAEIQNGVNKNWRKSVQKAGRFLDESGCLQRKRGCWTLTAKGKETADSDVLHFTPAKPNTNQISHKEIQRFLVEIAESLGFFAAMEYEFYDVVWRESEMNPRLSHIFEVQHKGNIDSAFAKLKRAYQNQRTKPFLIISSEKDINRARQSLVREFQEIAAVVTILTFVQVEKIHQNLRAVSEILPVLLDK